MRTPIILKPITACVAISFIAVACSGPPAGEPAVHQVPAASTGLMLNDSQIRLANITTQAIRIQEIGQSLLINARLVADETRSEVVSSRVAGRVEKLFVRETGRSLRVGEPFLELYSEDLRTFQQEYLLALDQAKAMGGEARHEQFVRSSQKKLLRYGLTEKQVDELGRTRTLSERIIFMAPAGGTVVSLSVTEGQYVDEGMPLYRVEDFRQLWVEADLYPEESDRITRGQAITVKIAGSEDKPLPAFVTFVAPEYRENQQITVMRAVIDNMDFKLQPGMQAQVLIRHAIRKALVLPSNAVIRGVNSAVVFILTDQNTFERRNVVTGLEDVDRVEIVSGLKEGDQVVVTGAYLLHSEMVLKGIAVTESHQH